VGLENENCVVTRPKFHDFRSFGIIAFQNGLEYYNFDFSRLVGNHFCPYYEHLMIFGLAILEL